MNGNNPHVHKEEAPSGIVVLSDVWFAYPGQTRTILRNLNLGIPGRSITAILGPNGTGKTTLLHLILGLHAAQSGTIQIAGQAQSSFTRRELGKMVGLVPQNEYITFDFTVFEYVLLGRAPYLGPLDMPSEQDRQKALDALRSMGIDGLQRQSVQTLSGGERQLVVVARALVQQPQVLLLDEPTAHLDLGNKSRILDTLRSLNEQGVTIILTTHDPEVASAVANFVVLMNEGQALHVGSPYSVLTAENLTAIYQVSVEVLHTDHRLLVFLA